jgi:hypothetical protein
MYAGSDAESRRRLDSGKIVDLILCPLQWDRDQSLPIALLF